MQHPVNNHWKKGIFCQNDDASEFKFSIFPIFFFLFFKCSSENRMEISVTTREVNCKSLYLSLGPSFPCDMDTQWILGICFGRTVYTCMQWCVLVPIGFYAAFFASCVPFYRLCILALSHHGDCSWSVFHLILHMIRFDSLLSLHVFFSFIRYYNLTNTNAHALSSNALSQLLVSNARFTISLRILNCVFI